LLCVIEENGQLKLKDQCSWEEEKQGLLKSVFENGKLVNEQSLSNLRERLNKQLELALTTVNA